MTTVKPMPKLNWPACVGCGYCCIKALCILGEMMVGGLPERMRGSHCPSLYWTGDKYRCRLAEVSELARRELSIDAGCCSGLNSWRNNIKRRTKT